MGALQAGLCDSVILFGSVNASGNLLASSCRCIIFWTSRSQSLVRGSCQDVDGLNHSKSFEINRLLSPPKDGYVDSSNCESSYLALNKSPVVGSRYLMMLGESYPTYIPILLCGPILVLCGGAIGM